MLLGFFSALLAGSLLEYWVHRGMHSFLRDTPLGRIHERHHRDYFLGIQKSFSSDLKDYLLPGMITCPIGFLIGSWDFGEGWLIGTWVFVLLLTYAHYYSHRNPPNHHLTHHEGNPHRALGVTSPIWDYVFLTR